MTHPNVYTRSCAYSMVSWPCTVCGVWLASECKNCFIRKTCIYLWKFQWHTLNKHVFFVLNRNDVHVSYSVCKCLHEEPIFINSQLKTKQVWFMFLQCHLGIKLTRMKRQWIHSRVWIFFISKCKDKTNNDALYTFLNIHQSDIDLLCNQRTVKRRYLFLNQ